MTEAILPAPEQPPQARLDWKDLALGAAILVAMMGLLVVAIVVVLLTGFLTPGSFEDGTILPALIGYQTLVFIAAAIAPVLRHRTPVVVGLRAASWRSLVAAAGIGFVMRGLVILALVGVTSAGVEIGNPQEDLLLASLGPLGPFLLLLLTGAVLTAIGEELLFRGVMFGWLRTHWAFWPAALASSLVFGLFHGINIVMPAAFAIGLVCAYLYERTRSIWPAVVVHLTNNLLVFVAARLLAG
ncbi:MAG: type II CAAX endopeptidase family protein [Dehalococcoidia bacterium]